MPTNTVTVKQFQELLSLQKDSELLLTPKLREDFLDKNKHFLKMRVSSSTNVFNQNVSSAFNFLADKYSIPQFKTAAWFTKFMSRWFTIMTSRRLVYALSRKKY